MTKSKKLKIIGEVILVISFLTQTLLFDYYNDESNELQRAYENQALIDKGAELKEIKYFIAKFPQDSLFEKQYQQSNIYLAAYKIALSQMMAILSTKGASKEEIERVQNLFIKAKSVSNFTTYSNFIDSVNSQSLIATEITEKVSSINTGKKLSRLIFIGLYLLGTCFLIYAAKLEKA
jgi:hypothetical protein